MNLYEPPSTPPEPRKPHRLFTNAQWAMILSAVLVLVVLVVLLELGRGIDRVIKGLKSKRLDQVQALNESKSMPLLMTANSTTAVAKLLEP